MSWFFRVVLGFFGFCVERFFTRRHLGGPPAPTTGPLLVVANHPNGLIDPLLVSRVLPRRLRFLAKAPLFRAPILGWILRRLGALPVFRAQDGLGTSGNREMFAAVHEALGAGDAVCIFPEGVSHDEPSLSALKTGAARMVLDAETRAGWRLGVRVVPVGLTYADKKRFRSDVATELGPAFVATDLADLHAHDERAAVAALTERIDAALRAVTLNLERWEDLPLIALAEAITRPEATPTDDPAAVAERAQVRVRAFAAAARDLEATYPERIAELRQRIARLRADLAEADIPPERLGANYDPAGVARFIARNLVALTAGLATAAVGTLAYLAPFWLTELLARVVRPTSPLLASVRLVGAVLVFFVWQVALTIAGVTWLGWPGVLLAWLALPPCGIYAARYVRRRATAARDVRRFFALATGRRAKAVASLVAERDAIRAELDALAALHSIITGSAGSSRSRRPSTRELREQ